MDTSSMLDTGGPSSVTTSSASSDSASGGGGSIGESEGQLSSGFRLVFLRTVPSLEAITPGLETCAWLVVGGYCALSECVIPEAKRPMRSLEVKSNSGKSTAS